MNLQYKKTNIYTNQEQNSDEHKCALLKFSHCHKKYPLQKLNKAELKLFIDYAKKIENMEWKDIRIDTGLDYKPLKHHEAVNCVPSGVRPHSMRINKKFRVIGWKEKSIFNIVWFDNNHEKS